MSPIQATITPRSEWTRVLIQVDGQDVVIARLGPLRSAHRHALRALLEAVALWHQQRVHVVLFVDDRSECSSTGLLDALEFGQETLHFDVEFVPVHGPDRAKRLSGLGSFTKERQRLRAGGRR